MVPLRVSEKGSRGYRIGTVGFAGLDAPTAGDPESRLRLSGALLSFPCRRLVSHINYPVAQQPPPRGSQRRTAAWGAGPLASGSAHAQSLPPACPGAVQQSALPLGPARPGTRARAQGPVLPEGGGGRGGVTGGREGGGGGGRVASGGARARPRARPPPCPNPARVKRFLPACSGRRDLTPRWRTARMSTRPKRAACPFSIQR